jgi:hypothetical protein
MRNETMVTETPEWLGWLMCNAAEVMVYLESPAISNISFHFSDKNSLLIIRVDELLISPHPFLPIEGQSP